MKRVNIKGKEFKVIPEAKLVQGEMLEKSCDNDLKIGIKPIYKVILRHAILYDKVFRRHSLNETDIIHANAYCDENDTWDESSGIEVCAAKLELKNHRKLAKMYDRISRDLQEAAIIAQSFCFHHEDKAQAIEDDLCRTFGRLKV